MDTDTLYCRDLVERNDRDRFILTLAAPAALRPALWALYAFNHEIAKTREVTREAAAGHMRLVWWRDTLDAFYSGAPMPAHDVARALGAAIRQHDLPKDDFFTLLDARAQDIDNRVPASLEDLRAYADTAGTPLIRMAARILGCDAPNGLGTAWSLTGLVRALPWLAAQGRCVLPLPLLHGMNLMPEQIHHLRASPALNDAVASIVSIARADLESTSAPNAFFEKHIRLARLYLRRIEKSGYNPFDRRVHGAVPFLGLRILF